LGNILKDLGLDGLVSQIGMIRKIGIFHQKAARPKGQHVNESQPIGLRYASVHQKRCLKTMIFGHL